MGSFPILWGNFLVDKVFPFLFFISRIYTFCWNRFAVFARKVTLIFSFFRFRVVWRKFQEVLRVEQLLLQIEQQELKRQRENLIMRKNLARRELDEGVKMLMTNNSSSLSLQDLNDASSAGNVTNGSAHYENVNNHHRHVHQNHHQTPSYQMNDYRKSMPNLQDFGWHQSGGNFQPAPPSSSSSTYQYPGDLTTSSMSEMHLNHSNLVQKPYQSPATHHHHGTNNNVYSNMTRHALMQISAVPKPKLTNDWVQFRKSEPVKPSINSHWLIQEAEQRRIEQLNNVRSKKPLPESVIQTLTQRVQNMGLGVNVNKRWIIDREEYSLLLSCDGIFFSIAGKLEAIFILHREKKSNCLAPPSVND